MTQTSPSRADAQHGVLTRLQALESGLSRKAVECHLRAGRWQRVHPGVYLTRPGPVPWLSRASAAVLAAGTGATLSLGSAAYLWGLRDQPPAIIAVDIPEARRARRRPGTRVRRRRHLEVKLRRGLPVTSPAQTVLDLIDLPGCSTDEAVGHVAVAVRKGRVQPETVLAELARRRTQQHRALLHVALGDVSDGIESVAEFLFVDRVERPHGLPRLVRQAPAADGSRRDFENTEFGVIVEIDGYLWHGREAFRADRLRDRRSARDGKLTLRGGWVDVASAPCDLALDVGLALRARGWRGDLTPCTPQCPVPRMWQAEGWRGSSNPVPPAGCYGVQG